MAPPEEWTTRSFASGAGLMRTCFKTKALSRTANEPAARSEAG